MNEHAENKKVLGAWRSQNETTEDRTSFTIKRWGQSRVESSLNVQKLQRHGGTLMFNVDLTQTSSEKWIRACTRLKQHTDHNPLKRCEVQSDTVLWTPQGSRVCSEPDDGFRGVHPAAGESIYMVNSLFLDLLILGKQETWSFQDVISVFPPTDTLCRSYQKAGSFETLIFAVLSVILISNLTFFWGNDTEDQEAWWQRSKKAGRIQSVCCNQQIT